MASPACQVKDGAGAYGPTTNGVNVTPTNTVTINLISAAGVTQWSISCIGTDDLSSAATVTAGLTIDSVAKTATFTAPAAGRAYIFQSKVNNGIGADGTADPSLTTTFGIYTLTAGGLRVHAVNETFESHSTFGWMADINSLIRSPVDSTFSSINLEDASATHDYIFEGSELAADRTITYPVLTGNDVPVFEAHAQTLTNKTLTSPTINTATVSSPTISGTPVITATTIQATGDSYCKAYEYVVSAQTTDATVTNLYTWTILDEAVTRVDAIVTAVLSTGATGASYSRTITFRRDGGTVSTVGSVRDNATDEDTAGWDVTLDNSTSTGRLRVTGAGGSTIRWGAFIRIQTQVP